MKKIILFMMAFVLFTAFGQSFSFAEGEKYVKVIYSNISIFSSADATGSAVVIGSARYGEKFKLKNDDPILGDDNFYYLKIEVQIDEYVEAYVFSSQVAPLEYSSPKRSLGTNATITKQAKLYTKVGTSFEPTDIELEAGAKVRLIGDRKENYSKIQYQDDDGDVRTFYVESSLIKMNGVSRATVGAIFIIVTTISIVLIIFGVKGKKKRAIKKLIGRK